MSSRSEQRDGNGESVLDRVRDYYHVPLLALAVAFSLWVRTRGWQNYIVDGRVLFSGNDPWYHYRSVQYTVRHWPFTMPFDPWTRFSQGTFVGQFGTLFDQIIATAALVVGLGNPTTHQVAMTHLFAPAVFGAFALIPAYLFASQVVGREGGLIAVLFLSLTTGQFLTRGVVGASDHHIAEVFFMALAAAAVAKALRVSMNEKPVWELVTAGEYDALRPVLVWGGLAGLAVALYLWTWPPGVFVIGILGVFFALAAALYQATGTSPDHVAAPGIVIGVVAGVLTLLTLDVFTISATTLSLLQPLLGFGLAAGCAFLAGFARLWDARELDRSLYPAGVLGVGVVVVGAFALVLPGTFDYFVGQVLRIFGYDATAAVRTVAEAQPIPLDSIVQFFSAFYGFGLFTAIAGAVFMLYKLAVEDEPRADRLLVLVLAVFLFMAAITQRRFEYYFALPVAVLNGYLAAVVFDLVDLRSMLTNLERPSGYQVMVVVAVLLLVAAPLVVSANGRTAPNVVNSTATPGEVGLWTGSLGWMGNNTPAMGAYGDGTPSEDLDYYGTYERTDDYQYDEGEYGTLAWWDYGHWITVLGHRVPNANPFQQNANYAADVLMAPDEGTATEMMTSEDGEETRYVMVDYQMGVPGTQKYAAPAAFDTRYNLSQSDTDPSNDIQRTIYNRTTGRVAYTVNTPRAYESLRVRLFQNNGGALIPSEGRTFVFDYETIVPEGSDRLFYVEPQNGPTVRAFQNRSAAKQFVEQEGSAQIGGLPGVPSKYVPALEHFRLVHASENSRFDRNSRRIYPAVKTFERVPGGTVEVEGPANTNVTASVEMKMTTRNQTFVYRQRARTNDDGVATFTLPYASTGYDEFGVEEGYTNTSVRATGPYEFATAAETNESTLTTYIYNGTGEVTEGQVLGEDDSTTTVELSRTVIDEPEGKNATNTTNGSDTQSALSAFDPEDNDGTTAAFDTPPSSLLLARTA